MADDNNEDNDNAAFEEEFNKLSEENDGIKTDDLLGDDLDNELKEEIKEDPNPIPNENIEKVETIEKEPAKVNFYDGMNEDTASHFKELEESNKKLKHAIDSDDGRVSALQKKINTLTTDLEHVSKKNKAPSQEELTKAMESNENWDKFKVEYPEVSNSIDQRLETHQKAIDEKLGAQQSNFDHTLAPVLEQSHSREIEENYDKVAKEFPSWQNVSKDVGFNRWLNKQPLAVQNIADSPEVQDTVDLFRLYDDHLIANNLPSIRPADHVNQSTVVDDNKQSALQQKRQQQQQDGVTLPSKGVKIDPSTETGTEFENVFNALAAREDAKNSN